MPFRRSKYADIFIANCKMQIANCKLNNVHWVPFPRFEGLGFSGQWAVDSELLTVNCELITDY